MHEHFPVLYPLAFPHQRIYHEEQWVTYKILPQFPKWVPVHPMSDWIPFFGTVGALAVLCHLLQGGFQGPLQCILYVPGARNPAFCRGCKGRSLVKVDADPCGVGGSRSQKCSGDQWDLASAESFLCMLVQSWVANIDIEIYLIAYERGNKG